MSLTILKDEEISDLLNNLTADELESFLGVLRDALYEYSTGTQAVKEGELQQPPRTSVTSPTTGATTLFMPSCSSDGIGIKVITLTQAKGKEAAAAAAACDTAASCAVTAHHGRPPPVIRPTGALTLYSATGRPLGILHASTLTAFRTALASSCLLLRRDHVRDVTVFGCGEQAYWHVRLALMLRGATVHHVYFIGRRFDACRAFLERFHRLPAAVKAREGWANTKFVILTTGYNDYHRMLLGYLRASDVIFCCTPSTEPLFEPAILTSHEGRRKGRLIVAIGSYTHHMRELPADLLRQATKANDRNHVHYHKHAIEGGVVVVDTLDGALKEAGEIIEAGLSPRHLIELGELVMLSRIPLQDDDDNSDEFSATNTTTSTGTTTTPMMTTPTLSSADLESLSLSAVASTTTSTTSSGGGGGTAMSMVYGSGAAAVDDSLPAPTGHHKTGSVSPSCKSSSSNLLSALSPYSHKRSSSAASVERRRRKEDHSARWLQRGNVIYKSVGLGLMDLSVGLHLIKFAREKGVGTVIDGF